MHVIRPVNDPIMGSFTAFTDPMNGPVNAVNASVNRPVPLICLLCIYVNIIILILRSV